MVNNELTYPLMGFTFGTRTNIGARILNNKDAALLILAANGGTMAVYDVRGLLRGWRPLRDGSCKTRYDKDFKGRELCFLYLFNLYYGHITTQYDSCGRRAQWHGGTTGQYSSGAYMWRPSRGKCAISSLGRARLNRLVDQARDAGVSLAVEVVKCTSAD